MTPKYLWNTDFFQWAKNQEDNQFDVIITDPPYTSFRNNLGESNIGDKTFDLSKFCVECHRLLKKDGIFISFCSIHLLKDYFEFFNQLLDFRCEQIWDKRPNRSWVSYGIPLRHVEYIVYFGEGDLNFKYGFKKPKYNRSQFGGVLRDTKKNTKKHAYSQYEQILDFKIPKKKKSKRKLYNKTDLKNSLENFGLEIKEMDLKNEKISFHPTRKPPEFSDLFKNVIGENKKILDPCCGSGALICSFGDNSLGIDIKKWIPVKPVKKSFPLDIYFQSII